MKKILSIISLLVLLSTESFAVIKTYIDNFNAVSYANNNGTGTFTGNWAEYEPYATDNDPAGGYIYIRSNSLYFYFIYAETISRELDLSGAATVTMSFNLVTNGLNADIQDIQLRNVDNTWVTIFSITDTTVTGVKTFTLDPQFIHSTSAIRFIARNNWNSNDNVYIDDLTFTADFIDTDGDTVLDNIDVDDDNDGILDINENSVQSDTYSNAAGGGTHTFNYNFTDSSTVTIDIATLDHAFSGTIDGVTLLSSGNILDAVNTAGRSQLIFLTDGGASGNTINNSATANSNGLPRVRIYIDDLGVMRAYGTRETTSTLLELLTTADGSVFNTFVPTAGNKEISITSVNDAGAGVISATNFIKTNIDNDGDGIVNSLDFDSDNDGIPDNIEAQLTGTYTAPSGTIDAATGLDTIYPAGGLIPVDTDADGINDMEDSDSDDDLVSDCLESYDPAGAVTPICPVDNVSVGNTVGVNGLVSWAETVDDYSIPNGVITNPLLDLDDEIGGNSEVAYREAGCGASEVSLTAFTWKTFSFACDTGANGVETLLGPSLGVYGENADWVMWEQVADYSGSQSSYVPLAATDSVVPGKGYWIITNANKIAKVAKGLSGISKTATTVPNGTNYPGVPTSGVSFGDVMPYTLPSSDAVLDKKVLIGNPFIKKFQLSDLYYQNALKSANYVPTTALISTDPMRPVVYVSDVVNGNYVAITPVTPGFTDTIPVMQGFWIKLNFGNTNTNKLTFPYER